MPLSAAINIGLSFLGMGGMSGWSNIGEMNHNLFAIIQDTKTGAAVRGRIISYSISDQQEWQNKFENMDDSNKIAILQAGVMADDLGMEKLKKLADKTLITQAQSMQVWTGIPPQSITLELEFRALRNPYSEVEAPIAMLRKMQAPSLKKSLTSEAKKVLAEVKSGSQKALTSRVLGDVPSEISIQMLGIRFNGLYVIESLDESGEGFEIKGNSRIKQDVSITFGSRLPVVKDSLY